MKSKFKVGDKVKLNQVEVESQLGRLTAWVDRARTYYGYSGVLIEKDTEQTYIDFYIRFDTGEKLGVSSEDIILDKSDEFFSDLDEIVFSKRKDEEKQNENT